MIIATPVLAHPLSHRAPRSLLGALLVVAVWAAVAQAQLRVVTYNTTGPPDPGMNIVLRSIGEELRNGIARPIDVLLLQETSRSSGLPDTQAFVNLLNNSIYAGQTFGGQPITYARGNLIGGVSFADDTSQSIVYRTQTVQLLHEVGVGNVSSSGQPRQALRYRLQPVGYDSSAEFYIYNSHYKASQDADPSAPGSNANRRNAEAIAIRANSNTLPPTAHIIYAGDHNFYDFDADEPALGTLLAPGNGQAADPIDELGPWHINPAYAHVHTQSPCTSGCGATGGMDDRFDFQLVSTDMLDGEGLDYIPGSYRAFGNNGSTFDTAITNGNTYNFAANGVTTYTKTQILNALATVTDHIPVVADYQLPAVMQAVAEAVPSLFSVGQPFSLSVAVKNAANVQVALGADELDYTLSATGAVTAPVNPPGGFTDAALGGENTHLFSFDTSTPGMKSGIITITSTSPMVQNGLINIPISFLVGLAGDYDQNGQVDAADYILWRGTLGQSVANGTAADGSGNGLIDDADFDIWTAHFGQAIAGAGAVAGFPTGATAGWPSSVVPEPHACVLALLGVCLALGRVDTLRGWTRKS